MVVLDVVRCCTCVPVVGAFFEVRCVSLVMLLSNDVVEAVVLPLVFVGSVCSCLGVDLSVLVTVLEAVLVELLATERLSVEVVVEAGNDVFPTVSSLTKFEILVSNVKDEGFGSVVAENSLKSVACTVNPILGSVGKVTKSFSAISVVGYNSSLGVIEFLGCVTPSTSEVPVDSSVWKVVNVVGREL